MLVDLTLLAEKRALSCGASNYNQLVLFLFKTGARLTSVRVERVSSEQSAGSFSLVLFEQSVGFDVSAVGLRPEVMYLGATTELVGPAFERFDLVDCSLPNRIDAPERFPSSDRWPPTSGELSSLLQLLDSDFASRSVYFGTAFLTVKFEPLTPTRESTAGFTAEPPPRGPRVVANERRRGETLKGLRTNWLGDERVEWSAGGGLEY